MRTIFIGFFDNHGTFTDKKTNEEVYYSNRDLRFITDTVANSNTHGFSHFEEKKFKATELVSILKINVTPTMTNEAVDNAINAALDSLINKEVITQFAPVGDTWKLVWFSAASPTPTK